MKCVNLYNKMRMYPKVCVLLIILLAPHVINCDSAVDKSDNVGSAPKWTVDMVDHALDQLKLLPPPLQENVVEVTTRYDDGIDENVTTTVHENCAKSLHPGQYLCSQPIIDPETQQPRGCQRETNLAPDAIECTTLPGLICQESQNRTFTLPAPCRWTNGYDFETTLLLSIFLGMFGADRFYLGYPAIGLLKFSTLGFFFLGHLLDIILIASQVVGPADGSYYIISYFGPGVDIVGINDETAKRPLSDWYN